MGRVADLDPYGCRTFPCSHSKETRSTRLPILSLLEAREKTAQRCAAENFDHLTYLLQLCELKSAGDQRLKSARFPNLESACEFDFAAQPSLNRVFLAKLLRREFVERRESVIFRGHPGMGKPHLAAALGIAACQRGKRVRFCRVTELVTQLMEAREERTLLRIKSGLAKFDLLILDELDYVPASKLGAALLFEVISSA